MKTKLVQWGAVLMVYGAASLVLPLAGLQIKPFDLFGEAQIPVGIASAVLGAAMWLIGRGGTRASAGAPPAILTKGPSGHASSADAPQEGATCPSCGDPVNPGDRFCTVCGKTLPHAATADVAPVAAEPEPPRKAGRKIVWVLLLGLSALGAWLFLGSPRGDRTQAQKPVEPDGQPPVATTKGQTPRQPQQPVGAQAQNPAQGYSPALIPAPNAEELGPLETMRAIRTRVTQGPRGAKFGAWWWVADLNSGYMVYALADFGSGAGTVAIPSAFLLMEPVTEEPPREQFVSAPKIKNHFDPNLSQVAFAKQVYRHFGIIGQWENRVADKFGTIHVFENSEVYTPAGKKIGYIGDVAINPFSGRIPYIFLLLGEANAAGKWEVLFPIPPMAFSPRIDTALALNIDEARLQSAPRLPFAGFEAGSINPGLLDPAFAEQVYRYYGWDPYWKTPSTPAGFGRNAVSR